jgi:hypothetical protein
MTTYLFLKYFLNNLEGTEGENKQVLGKIAVLVLVNNATEIGRLWGGGGYSGTYSYTYRNLNPPFSLI